MSHSSLILNQVQVASGKVVATRHVLQKGVPDIVGHKFDVELADLLEGSYKTKVLDSPHSPGVRESTQRVTVNGCWWRVLEGRCRYLPRHAANRGW